HGDQRGAWRSQDQGSDRRTGCDGISNLAERIWKIHWRRNREVGQGDPGSQHQARVRLIHARRVKQSPRAVSALSLNVKKTPRSWRGIVCFTHLAREGRMTVTIGRREFLAG